MRIVQVITFFVPRFKPAFFLIYVKSSTLSLSESSLSSSIPDKTSSLSPEVGSPVAPFSLATFGVCMQLHQG